MTPLACFLAAALAPAAWGARGLLSFLWREPGAFGAPSLQRMLANSLLPALAAAAAAAAAWGLGRRLLSLLGEDSEPEREAAAFALGAGALAAALLLLAAAGLLRPLPMGLVLLAFAAAARPGRLRRPALPSPRTLSPGRAALAGAAAFALVHAGILALAPVSDYDALVSHLALPRLYLAAGGLSELPSLHLSHFPHLMSLLYALPLAWGLEPAAALLHWAAFAALLLAVFRAAREELGEGAAWAGTAVLAVQPLFLEYAGAPRIEAWWALFHVLAFSAAWRWTKGAPRGALAKAGLFGGLAASTKLMGLASPALLAAWLLLQTRRGSPRERAGAAAAVLGLGLLPVLPWLVKNWLGTGNPVWPFLSGVFGDSYGAEAMALRLGLIHRWPSWSFPAELLAHRPQVLLGALAVLSASGLAARARLPGFLAFQWAAFLPYAAATVWNLNAWRYWSPWVPAMALTAGWHAARLLGGRGPGRALGAGALAAALLPAFSGSHNNALFAVLELRSVARPGAEPRRLYRERAVRPYSFLAAVNSWHEAAGRPPARLLLFHLIRGYHLEVPYQWGHPLLQGLVLYETLPDAEALGERLRELGVTHVVLNDLPEDHFIEDPRASRLMGELLRARGRPVLSEGGYRLVELR